MSKERKGDNQKLKMLYLVKIFSEETDDNHFLTMPEIIAKLSAYGVNADRKTIYQDIAELRKFGFDILTQQEGRNYYYFLGSREFELPELKLLVDAVQSSRFITDKKSAQLIKKLESLVSRYEGRKLHRQVIIAGRVKAMNETIYYIVDKIHEAISDDKQIRFRYFDWNLDGNRKYRDRDYQASPYGLCQDNENCYLLAHSERHGVTHYRVDRMTDIDIISDARIPCPELSGSNLITHANQLFQMYSGETQRVKLRFHRSLINVVVDRFGKDTMMIPDGDDHFVFTVDIAVSPLFLSWVIGFGSKVQILHPRSVADQCAELCMEVMNQYR